MNDISVKGRVVIYDDDHYYLGGVLAEKLRREGHEVLLVTPADTISSWSEWTLEQEQTQKLLIELGVEFATQTDLVSADAAMVELTCIFTDRRTEKDCDSLVLISERIPNDKLYHSLQEKSENLSETGIKTLKCIGDCLAPSTIAAAVYSGHLAARELESDQQEEVPFLRERVHI